MLSAAGAGRAQTGAAAGPAPTFVRTASSPLPGGAPEFDVVMCGGTLGIFLAAALQLRGLKVAVLERGPLKGRRQEWNISRKELHELVRACQRGSWRRPGAAPDLARRSRFVALPARLLSRAAPFARRCGRHPF